MPTIRTSVILEGERTFREQMDAISGATRVLDSELKKADTQFKLNSKSTEALTSKNEILGRALEIQEGKVSALTTEYEKANKEYGEADKRTLRLASSLNQAETAVAETKQAIEQNSKAIEENAKSTDTLIKKNIGLGDGLDKITESFGVRLPAGITKFLNGMDSATAKAALFTTIAVKLVKSMVNATVETAKSADEILRLSQTTGMSTDQIQVLKYAAEGMDVSFETVSGAVTKMIRSMSDAKSGTGAAAQAYKKLKIDVTDANGGLRDSNEVFKEVIDKLKGMKNETDRDSYAMTIFGKSARELNPLIEAGSAAIGEWTKKAEALGIVMNDATLKKYAALDDAMKSYQQSQIALTQTLGTTLLPILTSVFELLSKVPPDVIKVVIVVAAVVAGVIAVINVVKSVSSTVGALGKIFSLTNAQMVKTTAIIIGIVGVLTILAVAIVTITGRVNQMKEAFAAAGKVTNGSVPHYASGTDFHPGGWADVGEDGPERIFLPRGTKVLPNRQTMDLRRTVSAYAGGIGSFGGNNYYFSVVPDNVKQFSDLVRIADERVMSVRKGWTGR